MSPSSMAATALLALALLATTAHATCENLPLSFSTTNEIGYGRNRIRAGNVTVTLANGQLTAAFTLDPGCTLTDTIHINLLPTSTPLGETSIPVPGRFPCKEPASGTSQTVTCPVELFDLGDCCAPAFRLFTHLVVDCGAGANGETAFAGPTACTTRRWCDYEDVSVDVDCPVCNECSTEASACAPAATDSRCAGSLCIDALTTGELVCDAGQCVDSPVTTCETCNECSTSGGTAACAPVEADTRCTGSTCIDMLTRADNVCTDGSCGPGTSEECAVCQGCFASDGVATCDDLSTDDRCSGATCTSGITVADNVCNGGACVPGEGTTCSTCQSCVADEENASCENATEDDRCTGSTCTGPLTRADNVCTDGSCGPGTGEDCAVCQECSASEGVATCTDAESDERCTGATCTSGITVADNVCNGGACVPGEGTTCSTCQSCVADEGNASCENATEDDRCTGSTCTGPLTRADNVCTDGSCGPGTGEDCAVCQECFASEGVATCTDAESDERCTGATCTSDTKIAGNVCTGGACVPGSETTCVPCTKCVATGGPASCENVTEDDRCTGKECSDAMTVSARTCMSGECSLSVETMCADCNVCSQMGTSASCVFDPDSPTEEVCATCGEQCTDGISEAITGPGACEQNCTAEQSCEPGATDNLDVCVDPGCTMDTDCEENEICVITEGNTTGTCDPVAECSDNQNELCDQILAFLRTDGGTNEPGICCPATSRCVEKFGLTQQSLCATNCGTSCDPADNASGVSGVKEVFCRFGPDTAAGLDSVPRCGDIDLSK